MSVNKPLLTFFLLAILFYQTSSASTLQLTDEHVRVNLQEQTHWLVDESGNMNLSDVLVDLKSTWKISKTNNYKRTSGAYWFYIQLKPKNKVEAEWYMELAYTQLDYLDYYSRLNNGTWTHVSTGDNKPFSSRDVRYHNPVFKVPLQSGMITEILLRVESSTSISVPLTLWQKDTFTQHSQDYLLINGLSYGVLVALIFYNLFLYPTVRDSAYLWFSFYLISFVLFHFSLDGFSAIYLWPHFPVIIDRVTLGALWFSMAAGLRFTQLIGHMQQFTPRMNRLFFVLSFICLILAFNVMIFGPGMSYFLLPPLSLTTLLLIPLPVWIAWKNGYTPARFALFAFFPHVPGALLIIARMLNMIEPSFWTEHLFIIGVSISSILLSFALADRINLIRKEHDIFQLKLLESERQISKSQQLFSQKMIETQDYERKRIAAELHDGIGQNLSYLAIMLKRMCRKEGIILPTSIREATRDSIEEIRTISHQLHPHLLDKLGLVAAIEAIAERIQKQSDLQCIISMDKINVELCSDTELHLYRIAQEALSNVIKHSKATRVEFSLLQQEKNIIFSIKDNGKALKTTSASTLSTGLGLESISERAKLLSGNVVYKRTKPSGFELRLTIPIREASI